MASRREPPQSRGIDICQRRISGTLSCHPCIARWWQNPRNFPTVGFDHWEHGRSMTPSRNMLRHLRRMASRWPDDYFLFTKWKERLSGTMFSSESDVKTGSMDRTRFQPSRVKEVGPAFR
ncbi:hypothetical protein AVEN_33054-1 [Araneus ventricosus]|uniref:DUF4817 domain-containing protein n=1 Tax=Araneus ventricosus TaxID=182803 RepID=A0A4Y2UG82_ARAVE|nr:hypothetical protein AVEN_33054-1 [Araneus ventricosus]